MKLIIFLNNSISASSDVLCYLLSNPFFSSVILKDCSELDFFFQILSTRKSKFQRYSYLGFQTSFDMNTIFHPLAKNYQFQRLSSLEFRLNTEFKTCHQFSCFCACFKIPYYRSVSLKIELTKISVFKDTCESKNHYIPDLVTVPQP